jgi:hypothetical protein
MSAYYVHANSSQKKAWSQILRKATKFCKILNGEINMELYLMGG